jgi:hypothetical protein
LARKALSLDEKGNSISGRTPARALIIVQRCGLLASGELQISQRASASVFHVVGFDFQLVCQRQFSSALTR